MSFGPSFASSRTSSEPPLRCGSSPMRPYAEISEVMGTSEEAARRNVHEGLKRLRLEYQR